MIYYKFTLISKLYLKYFNINQCCNLINWQPKVQSTQSRQITLKANRNKCDK